MTRYQKATRPTADTASAVTGNITKARKPGRAHNRQSDEGSTSAGIASDLSATPRPAAQTTGTTAKAPRQSKVALLRARLAAPAGVSRAEMMQATGWQAHSMRTVLSGLRKAGLAITRRREGRETIYAVDAAGLAFVPDLAPDKDPPAQVTAAEADPGIEAGAPADPVQVARRMPDAPITEPGQGAA